MVGDRNRNARLARLRQLVPLENAIVGIDLADKKTLVPTMHILPDLCSQGLHRMLP